MQSAAGGASDPDASNQQELAKAETGKRYRQRGVERELQLPDWVSTYVGYIS